MNRRSLLLGSLVAGAAGLFGVKAKIVPPVEPDYESAGKAIAWLDKQHRGNVVPSGSVTLKDYQAAAELLRPVTGHVGWQTKLVTGWADGSVPNNLTKYSYRLSDLPVRHDWFDDL